MYYLNIDYNLNVMLCVIISWMWTNVKVYKEKIN